MQEVFPNIVPAANVLETGFSNINAIMHPAGMLGNAGWIEKSGGDFLWYTKVSRPRSADGSTPSIMNGWQSSDALGLKPLRFVEFFIRPGLTTLAGAGKRIRVSGDS